MADDQITVTPEAEILGLSEQQEKAAEVLADGGRCWQAAKVAGVDIRTVQRWATDETFVEYCVELRRSIRAVRRAKRERIIRQALDVQGEVLSGDRRGDDPAAKLAERILEQTEWRVWERDPDSWIERAERRSEPRVLPEPSS